MILTYIIIAALVWIIAANASSIVLDISRYFLGEKATTKIHFRPINPIYKKALEEYFAYYKSLNPRHKKIFEHRVQLFIDMKHFIPRNFRPVLPEMKAIIAASAVQLTYGLPQVYLRHFSKILIYPDDYYSVIFRKHHQGEVNYNGGLIVLGWKNFARGYMDDGDGKNLGLHEMAHAIRFENEINNGEYGFFDKNLLAEWRKEAEKMILRIKNGENGFFRDYAATNREEFFAVATENFFERPEAFKDKHPKLYSLLVNLLKQDPIVIKNSSKKL